MRLGPATLQNQRVRHADISPDGTLVAVSITSTNGARVVSAAVSSAVDGSYEIATPYGDGHTLMLLEGTGRVQALGTGVLPV